MTKIIIDGVPYIRQYVSFKNHFGHIMVIMISFPENDPEGDPIYTLDRNDEPTDLEAQWIPCTRKIEFV